MTDLLSLARRLLDYADEPGISEQRRHDYLLAADLARTWNAKLSGEEKERKQKGSVQ